MALKLFLFTGFRQLEPPYSSVLRPSSSFSSFQCSQTRTSTRNFSKCSWVSHLVVCLEMHSFISFLMHWVS